MKVNTYKRKMRNILFLVPLFLYFGCIPKPYCMVKIIYSGTLPANIDVKLSDKPFGKITLLRAINDSSLLGSLDLLIKHRPTNQMNMVIVEALIGDSYVSIEKNKTTPLRLISSNDTIVISKVDKIDARK